MQDYVNQMIKLSKIAEKRGEIPVGALIVDENGKIIAKAWNKKQKSHRCIDHAEILAITKAEKKLKTWILEGCSLYVTLEPCRMCYEVAKQARISKIFSMKIKKSWFVSKFCRIMAKKKSIRPFYKIFSEICEKNRLI